MDQINQQFKKWNLELIGQVWEQFNLKGLPENLQNYFETDTANTQKAHIEYPLYLGIYFNDRQEGKQIILGFGDIDIYEWNGNLQFGVYANEGHELDIWGEIPLRSPEKTLDLLIGELAKQVTVRAEGGAN
jgi:hypothetical protein